MVAKARKFTSKAMSLSPSRPTKITLSSETAWVGKFKRTMPSWYWTVIKASITKLWDSSAAQRDLPVGSSRSISFKTFYRRQLIWCLWLIQRSLCNCPKVPKALENHNSIFCNRPKIPLTTGKSLGRLTEFVWWTCSYESIACNF